MTRPQPDLSGSGGLYAGIRSGETVTLFCDGSFKEPIQLGAGKALLGVVFAGGGSFPNRSDLSKDNFFIAGGSSKPTVILPWQYQ